MSRENVEVVRAGFEAWNAGDMDAYRELLDPDVVMRPPERWPEPGPFVGREAALREFEQARETWNVDVAEPIIDFIEVGNRVVVRMIWHGQGQGPAVNMEMSCIYAVRNGNTWSSTSTGITPRPSKPPGCGSRWAAGYWAGDVAGERGGGSQHLRRLVGRHLGARLHGLEHRVRESTRCR
jgi:uncharacterized protein